LKRRGKKETTFFLPLEKKLRHQGRFSSTKEGEGRKTDVYLLEQRAGRGGRKRGIGNCRGILPIPTYQIEKKKLRRRLIRQQAPRVEQGPICRKTRGGNNQKKTHISHPSSPSQKGRRGHERIKSRKENSLMSKSAATTECQADRVLKGKVHKHQCPQKGKGVGPKQTVSVSRKKK